MVKEKGSKNRKISSWLTPYLRIVLPSLFILCAFASPVVIYLQSTGGNRGTLSLIAFVLFCLAAGFVTATTFWYRTVFVHNGHLLVSNYVQEISVPFSNIKDVTELRLRGHPVTVHLKEASEFGSKFTFLAKSRNIAAELKELAGI